jgi:hypothetical protein
MAFIVRDQEAGGSNPLAPTNSFNNLQVVAEQTAASFDRMAKEFRRVLRGQQALFALVDALTKAFHTCVPEPPAEVKVQSLALAKDRYTR